MKIIISGIRFPLEAFILNWFEMSNSFFLRLSQSISLTNRLIKKIKEFNPWINETNIKQVIRKITIPTLPNQIENNELIWQYLTKKSKLVVEQDLGDGKGRRNKCARAWFT